MWCSNPIVQTFRRDIAKASTLRDAAAWLARLLEAAGSGMVSHADAARLTTSIIFNDELISRSDRLLELAAIAGELEVLSNISAADWKDFVEEAEGCRLDILQIK